MYILLFFVRNYADVVFAWCQVISTYYHAAFQFVLPDKGSSAGRFEIVIIAKVWHSKREPLAPTTLLWSHIQKYLLSGNAELVIVARWVN